jgi:hypothetical protein
MATDHEPQQTRRSNSYRGRRGQDLRGNRRPQAPQQEQPRRDQVDIDHLMREIRSRVSAQHGFELSNQQIQELAARRLEALLDPQTVKPSLMDELRRSAGIAPDPDPAEPEASYPFDESKLYASPGGATPLFRRLFKPLLKLLINPRALVDAFTAQARLNSAAAARSTEERRRQTEWNGLHFEILRRLVVDIARADLERQSLTLQVESLSAKVDFGERRIRVFEQAQLQVRPAPRKAEPVLLAPAASEVGAVVTPDQGGTEDTDGSQRKRRRRRGRRSGTRPTPERGPDRGTQSEEAATATAAAAQGAPVDTGEALPDDVAPALFPQPVAAASESAAPDVPLIQPALLEATVAQDLAPPLPSRPPPPPPPSSVPVSVSASAPLAAPEAAPAHESTPDAEADSTDPTPPDR